MGGYSVRWKRPGEEEEEEEDSGGYLERRCWDGKLGMRNNREKALKIRIYIPKTESLCQVVAI